MLRWKSTWQSTNTWASTAISIENDASRKEVDMYAVIGRDGGGDGPWILLEMFSDEPYATRYAEAFVQRNPNWWVYTFMETNRVRADGR
jgi:hypothetical protein